MENILELSKNFNIQIYPSKVRIIPNDHISKKIFNLSTINFKNLVDGFKARVAEKINYKDVGDICSAFAIQVAEGFTVSEPFDLYDCAVLSVCISEWQEGNLYTTPNIIYRNLTGKIQDYDATPSQNQYAEILQSVKKLMRIQGIFDLSETCENLGYNDGKPITLISNILPCQIVKNIKLNGTIRTDVIHFTAESPLLSVSKLKNNQLLTFDPKLLNVPRQQNTRLNIMIKTYTMIRIAEIKLHRLTPSITFEDFFKKCRIDDATRKVQQRARESLIDFLMHLKICGVIQNFTVEKKGTGFRSIRFFYSRKS